MQVLNLKLFQLIQLIAAHPAILRAPSVLSLHRHADLAHRICTHYSPRL
jgi:hypothetical protein